MSVVFRTGKFLVESELLMLMPRKITFILDEERKKRCFEPS